MSLVMDGRPFDRPARTTMRDLSAPGGLPTGKWGVAICIALALHAGAVAAVYYKASQSDIDTELGAPAIEIGLDLAAPAAEQTDLPPGPQAEDSAAAPAMPDQKAEVQESALPKDTPTETDDPDRLVSENTVKKPNEDDPKIAAVQSNASAEAVASEAAAPPPVETATKSERSVAPAIGNGASSQRIRATWQKELVAHFDRHKRYPQGAPARTAEILVGFTLDRTGHLLSTQIVKSSGNAAFDEAALAMMRRSDPVPQPPPLVADEGLTFTVPVVFRVKAHG